MGSVQMISLGIIGEYLARIFLEVKGRPTFLIASVVEGKDRATDRLAKPQAAAAVVESAAAREDLSEMTSSHG
jgi:hypothetical protein